MPTINATQESVIEQTSTNNSETASVETQTIYSQNNNYLMPALFLGLSIPATLCYMLLPSAQRPSLPSMNLSNRNLFTAALATVGIGGGLYGFFAANKNDVKTQEVTEDQDEETTSINESPLDTIVTP